MCFKTVVKKTATRYNMREISELPSPKRRVSEVKWDEAQQAIVIPLPAKPWLISVQDTNSMDPLIDIGNTLVLLPANPDDLIVGDVLTYEPYQGKYIIHQIISIDFDGEGRYFTCQGLNHCPQPDKYKIRDDMVRYVLWNIAYT